VLLCAGLWIFGYGKGLLLLEAAFLVVLSLLAPRWLLRSTAARRRRRIKSEVPLFIHLLVLLFEYHHLPL